MWDIYRPAISFQRSSILLEYNQSILPAYIVSLFLFIGGCMFLSSPHLHPDSPRRERCRADAADVGEGDDLQLEDEPCGKTR
jgi:hypothetical protein